MVWAGYEDHLDRLVERMEDEQYLRAFAYPDRPRPGLESDHFGTLLRHVAQCDNLLAEKLLIRLAESEVVSRKLQGGIPQTYERSIAIVVAMGYLRPQTDETYETLARGVSRRLCMGHTIPLASLVRIGNERAAKLIRRLLFDTADHWSSRGIPYYLNELGRGRDRPAIFGLLVKLAQEAPSPELQRRVLDILVRDRPVKDIGHSKPIPFPSYQTLSDSTRDTLRELVKGLDATKPSAESRELLGRLREMLAKPPPPGSPPDLDKAWSILDRPADADVGELSKATLDVVRAGNEEDLDRLVERMEDERYLDEFAYPSRTRWEEFESYAFSKLMRQVAESGNLFAEKLLIRLAQSDVVCRKLKAGGASQGFERSYAIVEAMGYLQPRTDETYEILARGVSGSLCTAIISPLRSLVRIGDERAAEQNKRHLFRTPGEWSIRRTPYYLAEMGKGRDRPGIFGLLNKLAEEAPGTDLERRILETLVRDKVVIEGAEETRYVFPSYQTASDSTRAKLRKLADATKVSSESAELLASLRQMLAPRE